MSFADVGYRFRYMEWAKTVMEAGRAGVIDIGSSGIARVSLRELGVRLRDLELFGPHYYGERETLRRIARMAGVETPHVLPTLGASHAWFLVCASLLSPGDEAVVETPGYEALAAVPRVFGAVVKPLARRFENGFQPDPQELRAALTPKTRLIVVSSPHNPSGVTLDQAVERVLADIAGESASMALPESSMAAPSSRRSRGAPGKSSAEDPTSSAVPGGPWVVVNEVYRGLAPKDRSTPGHRLGGRGVSIGSLTKVHGLGETRVGWAITHPALVHRASRVNDFGAVNGPYISERIGALALAHHRRLLARARAIASRNRKAFAAFLRATPEIEVVPSRSLLVFPRLRGVSDTRTFTERALERQRVCVVPGDFVGAPAHIRIGLGTKDPRRFEEGLRRLGRALRNARS